MRLAIIWLARQFVRYICQHTSRKLARRSQNWQGPLESGRGVPEVVIIDNKEVLMSLPLSRRRWIHLKHLLPSLFPASGLSGGHIGGSGEPLLGCCRRERTLSRNSDGNECFKWMYLLPESGPDIRTSLLSSQKVQGTTGPLSRGPCQF